MLITLTVKLWDFVDHCVTINFNYNILSPARWIKIRKILVTEVWVRVYSFFEIQWDQKALFPRATVTYLWEMDILGIAPDTVICLISCDVPSLRRRELLRLVGAGLKKTDKSQRFCKTYGVLLVNYTLAMEIGIS